MKTGEEVPLSRSMPPLKLSYAGACCAAPIGVAVVVDAELDSSSIQAGFSLRSGAQSVMLLTGKKLNAATPGGPFLPSYSCPGFLFRGTL